MTVVLHKCVSIYKGQCFILVLWVCVGHSEVSHVSWSQTKSKCYLPFLLLLPVTKIKQKSPKSCQKCHITMSLILVIYYLRKHSKISFQSLLTLTGQVLLINTVSKALAAVKMLVINVDTYGHLMQICCSELFPVACQSLHVKQWVVPWLLRTTPLHRFPPLYAPPFANQEPYPAPCPTTLLSQEEQALRKKKLKSTQSREGRERGGENALETWLIEK